MNRIEDFIQKNTPYDDIPKQIQNSELTRREYEKQILSFSIRNQLEYRGNLVETIKDKSIRLNAKQYHEELIKYSKEHLMLYPYHLSDLIVKGLNITPFRYYYSIMESIMEKEKSYDSLPNFTAADCLRLLGIGRNEYIELMNKFRSSKNLFRRRNVKTLLPQQPIDINIEPWWLVERCDILEEDMRNVSDEEKAVIDHIMDREMNSTANQKAGDLDYYVIASLYKRGLIYLKVPIYKDDYVALPPLEGFVMNRVLGDSIENLLYKIFVSIDERTSIEELASVLQIDLKLVKNAVSLYCRLGFGIKKTSVREIPHASWLSRIPVKPKNTISMSNVAIIRDTSLITPDQLLVPPNQLDLSDSPSESTMLPVSPCDDYCGPLTLSPSKGRRMAFLFDSTLTAYLMMGNLSPGLRSHAVTMFEVGKLSDESLDSFLSELEKVSTVRDASEGEAKRYFEHALILRKTILTLRNTGNRTNPLDLVRCESLESLDKDTVARLLNKNYLLLISMAPLCKEITPITSVNPPHLGPAHPEMNTFWFKLFLYHILGIGPATVLFVKGTRVLSLPRILQMSSKLLVTSWGHEPVVMSISVCLFTINDYLLNAPVLVQAYGWRDEPEIKLIPFPSDTKAYPTIQKLGREIDLVHNCGYITLLNEKNLPLSELLPRRKKPVKMETGLPTEKRTRKKIAAKFPKKLETRLSMDVVADTHMVNKSSLPMITDRFLMEERVSSTALKDIQVSQPGTSEQIETGVTSSIAQEPIPSLGGLSEENAYLLREELDHLTGDLPNCDNQCNESEQVDKSTPEVLKPDTLAIRPHVPEKPLGASELLQYDGWVLIDCCFGVPLFDHKMNKHICDAILNRNLWGNESLAELTKSNEVLCKRLTNFINEFQDFKLKQTLCNKMKFDKESQSWPMRNLMFHGGKVKSFLDP